MRLLVLVAVLLLTFHFTDSYYKTARHKLHKKQKRATVQCTTVLILGGGIAGVTAANTLQAAGISDFILLEGSKGVGGRARGANWIHGVEKNANPLVPIAKAANLQLFYTANTSTLSARDSNGRDVTDSVSAAMTKEQAAEKMMYKSAFANGITTDSTVKDALKTLAGWEASTPAEVVAEYFQIDYVESIPPSKASLLGNMNNNEQEKYGKEEAYIVDSGGFSKGVSYMASQVFATGDQRLRLNELVTEVHTDPANDQSIPLNYQNDGVYVVTASGNAYWAKYCIITFSNAVILSGNVKFVPALPDWKVRALKQMPTAVYDKVIIKFASDVVPFWDPTQWIFFVDSQQSYGRGYYTVWLNLTIQGIFPGSNMLVTFLVDDMAKASELKSDADIRAEVIGVLRKMYGSDVPEPESVSRTKTYSNPLSLGAFHSIVAGVNSTDIENFSRGIRNLQFAGDGADAEFFGLLQGAYKTGVKTANTVIKGLSQTK